MDTSTIDQACGQLRAEFQDVAKSVQTLAEKLQTAAQGGDQNAREWALDLERVALDVKPEQMQVNALLQTIHNSVDTSNRPLQQQIPQVLQMQQFPQVQQGGFFDGGGGRGRLFGGLLGGGFGRGMAMGAGIGLGDDLVNSIF